MKCRKCTNRAVINMRQHKLALCKDHFIEWVGAQTDRFIQKYRMFGRTEKVLLAVSGGKDSLSLWDVLWKLGYQVDGIYIQLGIDDNDYSITSGELSRQFAAERGLILHSVNIKKQYGENIPEIAKRTKRGSGRHCAVCGLVKRHEMNRIALEGGYSALLTGHNLDDEVATLFGNSLKWSMNLLYRQAPVLPAENGFVKKAKPFCRILERESAAYAILRGIDYIYEECPYAVGSKSISYKEAMNKLEEISPGTKQQYYIRFLEAKENGAFPPSAMEEKPAYENQCRRCGQPTTITGLCSFCRLFE